MKLPTKIPKKFWPYFWDVDPKKVNPSEKSLFVIQRLLDWNNFSAAHWVITSFPPQEIIKSLTNFRGWSKRSENFWKKYFKLSKKTPWNGPESQRLPISHWNY